MRLADVGKGATHAEPEDPCRKRPRFAADSPEFNEPVIGEQLWTMCSVNRKMQEWMHELGKRLGRSLHDHDDDVQASWWNKARWDQSKDTFLQLKSGMRLEDLRFEFDAYKRLQPFVLKQPKYTAECMERVWKLVESPMRLLLEYTFSGQDDSVNATEVIPGFAFIAAGGLDPKKSVESQNPIMVNHHHKTDTARLLHLQEWYKRNRVRYILNLAKGDSGMGEYPNIPGTSRIVSLNESGLEQHQPARAGQAQDDFEVPEDDDDDEAVYVLNLPMQDSKDYDLARCTYSRAEPLHMCACQLVARGEPKLIQPPIRNP
jgi:hypothetical protein